MKRLLIFLALLWCGSSTFAATPAFTDFEPTQFGVAGNKVVSKSGLSLTNLVLSGVTNTGSARFNNGISLATGNTLDWNGTTFVYPEAVNALAIRAPTGTNVVRLYGLYTDAGNNNLVDVGFPSAYGGGIAAIRAYKNGSGVAPELYIDVPTSKSLIFSKNNGNTTNWKMDNTGHFLAGTDNTYDIGASGANRPRTGYFGTDIVTGNDITVGRWLKLSSSGQIRVSSDGVFALYNAAVTDFNRLQFGGTTASYPALKRNGSGFDIVGADGTYNSTNSLIVPGSITATNGLQLPAAATITVRTGTNQRAGNATLASGTVTVNNTTVTANTLVLLTRKISGGTLGMAITYTLSAGNSFTINSDNVLDTSTLTYFLVENP